MIDRFAIGALILTTCSVADIASAQANIPAPVIQQCNTSASANDLPDCLREGAVAFEMLNTARSSEFYGEESEQVIDICAERNETFHKTWICFKNAAADAADTNSLIGIENISDQCVAAISDPETYNRLDELYQVRDRAMFPDRWLSGGDMYSAFRGCPMPAAPDTSQTEGSASETVTAPKDTLSSESCEAYSELEDLIASSSTTELREVYSELEASEDKAPSKISDITGLSIETVNFVLAKDDAGEQDTASGMFAFSLVGMFLRDHHPELFEELIVELTSDEEMEDDEFTREAAKGMFVWIIDRTEEKYASECQ